MRCFWSSVSVSVSVDSRFVAVDDDGGEIGVAVAGLTARCSEAENKAAVVVRVTKVVLRREGLGFDDDDDEEEALMERDGGGFCRIWYEFGLGWNLM
ncbi:unnamed protein product [Arabis nemorensis]|uniref:Uncharacterized protein n=1 Tax=Arabis nemorensis TaxID=586526 RepID=A0A565CH54_9BRAS|nr:unnamed protein product [Arabis nemorensis]